MRFYASGVGSSDIHFDTPVAPKRPRALGLFSGGLDSQLAVCVLRRLGIHSETVFFESPFADSYRARRAAADLGVFLHVVDFTRDIVGLIENPKHGFGSCLNPCIDCHALMIQRTADMMREMKFDFVFTGEVLDQRPMSQRRQALDTVARESGENDAVLRPLSALKLPPTQPERTGLVDRSRLLDIEGRGRRRQFEMAEEFGLHDYPAPAGGCRLTEPNYCRRLLDLKKHEGLFGAHALDLQRVGRHFRLSPDLKAIVGRNENDNAALEGDAELYDLILKTEDVPGPTALLPFTASESQIRLAAAICARYSDGRQGDDITVKVRSARETRRVKVKAAPRDLVDSFMI